MKQVQILWVGRFYKSPGDGIRAHSHPFYHMMFVHAGQLSMTVDGRTFPMHKGQCILIPPGMTHVYLNTGSDTYEGLEIKFTIPAEALDAQYAKGGELITEGELTRLLFEQIVREYSELGSKADEAAESYLLALLHTLTEQRRMHKKSTFRFIEADNYSELAQRTIRWLEAHFAEDICLDDLAAAVGHNKSYLCVAFKKNTQITINDCLNMIRIRRAAELIAYSDNDLTQIASMCGFSTVSHFNRVFLKHVGATPGQCRRAYPSNISTTHGLPKRESPERWARSDRFMYGVLAKRKITPEMVMEFEKKSPKED